VIVVDPVVDAASGTFGVRLELPNPEHAIPAGLKCRVRF
jgi:multidrug efflux pump subunit AcrA (membrane-fusion protein)